MYPPEASNYSQFMKSGNAFMRFISNSFCLNHIQNFAILCPHCGRSSVVERHVANVNVEGSSPFARFHFTPISVFPIGVFYFCGVLKKVKRFAERVAPVAQTTHPSQAGLARVLNSLVVPPFLRRGNL